MPKAYILINCKSGNETLVAATIKSIEDVLTCSIVYGVYDIIVEILFDKIGDLEDIIQKRIRKIINIQSTMTLIPYDFN
ncbi:MAG TPA: Lrp/AsnC ligand binding domain-containing protein [Nitrososphaeraceae archaeon]|nr:Lrp/AsnC ligand binding domain-containing protein [Nitrososphaeraceae archaeon]